MIEEENKIRDQRVFDVRASYTKATSQQSADLYEKNLKLRKAMFDICDMAVKKEDTSFQTKTSEWHIVMRSTLAVVCARQNSDDLSDFPVEVFDKFPQLAWPGQLLLQEGFLQKIEVADGAFPYRITFKGLVLYSMLDSIASPRLSPHDCEQIWNLFFTKSQPAQFI